MASRWVEFRAVKQAISMEMAVAYYGIALRRVPGSCLRGRCPLPTHTSTSSYMSFIVDMETNGWSCHSHSCAAARGGYIGGNVLDFVAVMENCSVREAAIRLQDRFIVPMQPTREQPTESRSVKNVAPVVVEPLRFTLRGIDCSYPYLVERGVRPEIARHFGIGYYGGNGYMKGRIVIPIHNEDGVLVAYVGRAPGNAEPKYRFPPRFRKSLVLYNLHRAIAHGKRVIVVEGFFGCLKVHEAGFPCVVALMGASLSQRQEQFLERYFHEVVLMLDGDSAGRTAAAKIAARLVPHLAARVVELPTGSEPDQLSGDQIRCFCDPNYF
jgi:DNA primase